MLEGVGHLLPFEKPAECAERAARWINEELIEWKQAHWERSKRWRRTSQQEKEKITEEWIEGLRVDVKAKL